MALFEMLLVVKEVSLPTWFFPSNTTHDIVQTMHRLFPAYMNACRCLTSAFYRDKKDQRVAALDYISAAAKDLYADCNNLVLLAEEYVTSKIDAYEESKTEIISPETDITDKVEEEADRENVLVENVEEPSEDGVDEETETDKLKFSRRLRRNLSMAEYLREVERRVARDGRQSHYRKWMEQKMDLIINSPKYVKEAQNQNRTNRWEIIRNFVIYAVIRYFLAKRQSQSVNPQS
jgi:hypothetical protein